MRSTMEILMNRRSVRSYEDRPVSESVTDEILNAAMRAPTAGKMMLYSIIRVKDRNVKETLSRTCDNQPMIAEAPLVLLFLADYQRWYDYFIHSGVERLCAERGLAVRRPEAGDLILACCDALVAAQTAVIAAESLGIGSCYIGDIMENYETHRDLFRLPRYVFPICLLCLGYPKKQDMDQPLTTRLRMDSIVFDNEYRTRTGKDLEAVFSGMQEELKDAFDPQNGVTNLGQMMYVRKFDAEFTREMNRSVRAMLQRWNGAAAS